MSDEQDKPLSDAECAEMMELIRVIREGHDTPEDFERYAELRIRFAKHRQGMREEAQ